MLWFFMADFRPFRFLVAISQKKKKKKKKSSLLLVGSLSVLVFYHIELFSSQYNLG